MFIFIMGDLKNKGIVAADYCNAILKQMPANLRPFQQTPANWRCQEIDLSGGATFKDVTITNNGMHGLISNGKWYDATFTNTIIRRNGAIGVSRAKYPTYKWPNENITPTGLAMENEQATTGLNRCFADRGQKILNCKDKSPGNFQLISGGIRGNTGLAISLCSMPQSTVKIKQDFHVEGEQHYSCERTN
jgi:hypothetical protein